MFETPGDENECIAIETDGTYSGEDTARWYFPKHQSGDSQQLGSINTDSFVGLQRFVLSWS